MIDSSVDVILLGARCSSVFPATERCDEPIANTGEAIRDIVGQRMLLARYDSGLWKAVETVTRKPLRESILLRIENSWLCFRGPPSGTRGLQEAQGVSCPGQSGHRSLLSSFI
ncbi:hypothetical protein Tco_0911489 [Tanacetum coccineum]|uniref:Uncharacterized protein n=1 Tax=Tanacetum coccineum TaxID=301880 RepID=A0ABQ5D271_9ASTR